MFEENVDEEVGDRVIEMGTIEVEPEGVFERMKPEAES
jgi:hypothetical protein